MRKILFFSFISLQYIFAIAQQSNAPYEFQTRYHMLDSSELYVPHVSGKAFTTTAPPVGSIRAIAEWEPAQAVVIAAYHSGNTFTFGIPYTLIAEMSENCKVITLAETAADTTSIRTAYNSNGVTLSNCIFKIAPLDSYWTRDYGPWFIMTNNNTIAIVDFPYNRPTRPNDDNVPVFLAGAANLNEPLYGMNVMHTGGNYMCDGMGVAAMTNLVLDENTSLTEPQIDTLFKQYMGVDRCYITSDPLNDYIKHVDCWGKFLDVDKILIASVPTSNANYNDYEAMATYWANKVSSYGNNYQVYRVYEPSGQPYTNSLILNKKVLVPMNSAYGTTNNSAATAVYQQAMPGYEILGFQQLSSAAWASTDALHCRAHEIADKGMLYIKHYPLLGQKPLQTNYTINADVYALSGSSLISDSAWVRYRVNHGSWQQTLMTNPSGNLWTADIPANPPAGGDTIEYYIHASDLSPRSMTHPLIGSPDPHKFWTSTVTSLPENLQTKVLIFPNPAVDYIFIQPQESSSNISIRMLNSLGAEVRAINMSVGNRMIKIPVNDLPSGTYFVQVSSGSNITTQKVMIMH
jgi:agmatine deiminase